MKDGEIKTVLAFGVFDLLHEGHRWFLHEAANLGRLVVVIARDENTKKQKGYAPEWDEERRRAEVEVLPWVAEARLGYEDWRRHKEVLDDVKPDVIVQGYDQTGKIPEGPWEVVRLGAFHPETYKSSLIRGMERGKEE